MNTVDASVVSMPRAQAAWKRLLLSEYLVLVLTVVYFLASTHWKRRVQTVAMLSPTAIGEYYLRPVDY